VDSTSYVAEAHSCVISEQAHEVATQGEILMKRILELFALALALGVAGCGGGGGGGSAVTRSATVPVFVTDDPETANAHVWATIYKIEVQNANGQSETVFDDSAGRSIDLKTLHDASGQRFAFLTSGAVTSGTHTGIRVTMGSSLTLFPLGATTGQAVALDDSIARDSLGHAPLTFPLATPRNLASGSDDVVVDFDLAHFTQQNGKITPSLHEGDRSTLHDASRQEGEDHDGAIANLTGTAPNFTFTLQVEGTNVTVVTDATTVFFNTDSSANPTLANGKTVEVTGTFDPATNRLAAKSVKIEDRAQHASEVEVDGVASTIAATTGTFSVSTQKVRGFVPAQTTVSVVTNTTTVFRSNGGVTLAATDFFTLLATAQNVEVEGTYDTASNTLTATSARIEVEHEGNEGHDGEARGTAINVQSMAGTFMLQPVTEFDGFALSGNSVNVVTNGSTQFRSGSTTVTAAAFFAALTTAQSVQAEGTFSAGTITASSVRILTSGSGGGGGGDDGGGGH
jgi:hypothetical protein